MNDPVFLFQRLPVRRFRGHIPTTFPVEYPPPSRDGNRNGKTVGRTFFIPEFYSISYISESINSHCVSQSALTLKCISADWRKTMINSRSGGLPSTDQCMNERGPLCPSTPPIMSPSEQPCNHDNRLLRLSPAFSQLINTNAVIYSVLDYLTRNCELYI